MNTSVIRTPIKPSTESLPEGKESSSHSVVNVEPPYLDYEAQNSKPYMAEYFELGDNWNDKMGGFSTELSTINNYIEQKIKSGDIGNSIEAVRREIKSLEKINNLKGEERPVVKIEILSAYIEFLNKKLNIKTNLLHYGNK